MEATPERARVYIDRQQPQIYKAQLAVSEAVREATDGLGLDRKLVELVNVRASQINGCAFCLDIHSKAALAAGETEQRLAVLPGWRRSQLYTLKEQAALVLAELTTTLPDTETQDRGYAFARQHLTDDELAALIWVAVAMNSFNRVSILSLHPVRPPREGKTT